VFWSEGMLPRYSWPTSQSFLRTYLRYDIMILLASCVWKYWWECTKRGKREQPLSIQFPFITVVKYCASISFVSSCQVVHYDRR